MYLVHMLLLFSMIQNLILASLKMLWRKRIWKNGWYVVYSFTKRKENSNLIWKRGINSILSRFVVCTYVCTCFSNIVRGTFQQLLIYTKRQLPQQRRSQSFILFQIYTFIFLDLSTWYIFDEFKIMLLHLITNYFVDFLFGLYFLDAFFEKPSL